MFCNLLAMNNLVCLTFNMFIESIYIHINTVVCMTGLVVFMILLLFCITKGAMEPRKHIWLLVSLIWLSVLKSKFTSFVG